MVLWRPVQMLVILLRFGAADTLPKMRSGIGAAALLGMHALKPSQENMNSPLSELILTPANVYADGENVAPSHPFFAWKGLPLNRYRSQIAGERGPCHVDCPAIVLDVTCRGRRWIRENGRKNEFGCLPGTMELYGREYEREWARWDVTPGYTIGLRLTDEAVKRLAPEASGFDIKTKHDVADPKVEWLIHELDDEWRRGNYGDALYAESISRALIARLVTDYGSRKAADSHVGGLAACCRRKIVDFIEENLGEDLSITALAKEVALSSHHFSRCFATSFGEPPHRYIRRRRIEVAFKMLSTTNRSVAEIAFELGFSSQSHFSQAFQQQIGLTPLKVRSLR